MPSASAISGCASCSGVNAVCTSGELSGTSDLPGELPPFPSQRLLDDATFVFRAAGFEADGERQLLVAFAMQQRRGATTQKRIDLALFRVNAAAAAVLDGRADIGPRRLCARGEGGERLRRQQRGSLMPRQAAEQRPSRGGRPKRI